STTTTLTVNPTTINEGGTVSFTLKTVDNLGNAVVLGNLGLLSAGNYSSITQSLTSFGEVSGTVSYSPGTIGQQTLTGHFSGGAPCPDSTSNTVQVTILEAVDAVVHMDQTNFLPGQSITIHATAQSHYGFYGEQTPNSGLIDFYVDGVAQGGSKVDSNG